MRRSAFCRRLWQRLELTFRVQQDQVLDTLDQLTPKTVVDRYSNTKRTRRASLGDIRVNQIRQMLETGMGVQRSKMQVRFHEAFLAATSRHLYQSDENVDWKGTSSAGMERHPFGGSVRHVLFVIHGFALTHSQPPRRACVLASQSVGLFIAAYAVVVPRSNPFSPQASLSLSCS